MQGTITGVIVCQLIRKTDKGVPYDDISKVFVLPIPAYIPEHFSALQQRGRMESSPAVTNHSNICWFLSPFHSDPIKWMSDKESRHLQFLADESIVMSSCLRQMEGHRAFQVFNNENFQIFETFLNSPKPKISNSSVLPISIEI